MHRDHVHDPREHLRESPVTVSEELRDREDHHFRGHQLGILLRRLHQVVQDVVVVQCGVLSLLYKTLCQFEKELFPSGIHHFDLEPTHKIGEHVHHHEPPHDDHAASVLHELVLAVLEAVNLHSKCNARNSSHSKLVCQGVQVDFLPFSYRLFQIFRHFLSHLVHRCGGFSNSWHAECWGDLALQPLPFFTVEVSQAENQSNFLPVPLVDKTKISKVVEVCDLNLLHKLQVSDE